MSKMPALQEDPGEQVPAGALVYDRGERLEQLLFLAEGEVRLCRGQGSAELCLGVVDEGDFFGEAFLFDEEIADHCALAARDCRLLRIDEQRLEDLMAGRSELGQRLLRHLARRLRDSQRARVEMLERDEGQRLLGVLRAWVEEGRTRDDGSVSLDARASAARLACGANVSLERARQVLSCLVDREILLRTEEDAWVLTRREALEEYAEYLKLKARFDPLSDERLMGLSGLGSEELKTLSERLLRRRLGRGQARERERLQTPLMRYYQLKSRFEYGCAIPTAMGD